MHRVLSVNPRRAIRRPHYRREDLKIEVRDDLGDFSSDDDDSPSPDSSTFPPNAQETQSFSRPQRPRPVLNPANPTEDISSTKSTTSSDFPRTTAPLRETQREQPSSTFPSVTSAESSSSTRTLPTAVPQTTTVFNSQPTGATNRGGSEAGLGNDRSTEVGWTPTAIAFGTIAIAALVLVIGVGIWWCLRFQKRRKARQLYDRNMSPDGRFWDPSATYSAPAAPSAPFATVRRSPSSVMAELMGHAYANENGNAGGYYGNDRNSLTPEGYLDEKRYDPARQLPVLEPAPVAQPNVRNSIASWIRRHHPLKLNPLSGRSSVYSTRTIGASTRTVNAPPVPAMPDVYRGTDHVDNSGLGVPQNNPRDIVSSRYDTSRHSTGSDNNSLLSLYQNQPQHEPGQAPWLMDPPPVVFGERGVSMAPTEATTRTESTWRTWGGGIAQPQNQAPPETPRRGWIEKCIKFGGLK
ncbi:uncharacterized protein ColSpa_12129 [Colletotrichum spaethianum]|uniref:Uncharacterized protein n=1 Tax=Colletotrichum spaethianum TaxID=700344 RepID=A0AA37UTH8_9PEZI|nr:uncharacterized protein ColSpa_12129 [Colletotrichum spaethianum]GKT51948.1 hypothetical protein ColSpa_12129 [Colletotrichum spaethianum]